MDKSTTNQEVSGTGAKTGELYGPGSFLIYMSSFFLLLFSFFNALSPLSNKSELLSATGTLLRIEESCNYTCGYTLNLKTPQDLLFLNLVDCESALPKLAAGHELAVMYSKPAWFNLLNGKVYEIKMSNKVICSYEEYVKSFETRRKGSFWVPISFILIGCILVTIDFIKTKQTESRRR